MRENESKKDKVKKQKYKGKVEKMGSQHEKKIQEKN